MRASQEKALQALQAYTLGHYPDTPAKFGELLLRIPELQRTCQVCFVEIINNRLIKIKKKNNCLGWQRNVNYQIEGRRGAQLQFINGAVAW